MQPEVAAAVVTSHSLYRRPENRRIPKKTSTAAKIPLEILENIFILLRQPLSIRDWSNDALRSLAHVNLVCHFWAIASTPILYKWVVLHKARTLWLFTQMLRSTSRGPLVRTIYIYTPRRKTLKPRRLSESFQPWDRPAETGAIVDTILENCSNLSELSVVNMPQLREVGYPLRATSIPSSLQILSFTASCVQLVDAVSTGELALPLLHELHLRGTGQWGAQWTPLPNLRKLALNNLRLTQPSLERLLAVAAASIEVLIIHNVDQEINLDIGFPRLRELDYRVRFRNPRFRAPAGWLGLNLSKGATPILRQLIINETSMGCINLPSNLDLQRLEIKSFGFAPLSDHSFHSLICRVEETLTHLTIWRFPLDATVLRASLAWLRNLAHLDIVETMIDLTDPGMNLRSIDSLTDINLPLDVGTPTDFFLNNLPLPPATTRLTYYRGSAGDRLRLANISGFRHTQNIFLLGNYLNRRKRGQRHLDVV